MTLEFTPRQVVWLLAPAWLGLLNRRRQAGKGDWFRLLLFGGVASSFSLGIFGAFYHLLTYVGSFSEFASPLTHQILATVSTFVLTVLLVSNIVTALSTQFLSEDLSLLVSSPVPLPALYGARFILTLTESSWMVLTFSIPIFAAFAVKSHAPLWFLLGVGLVLPPMVVIAAALGGTVTSVLMASFPARRVREILMMMGAIFVGILIFLIRAQQPERLLNPRAIYDVAEFFSAFRTPSSPVLPSAWATEVMSAGRIGGPLPLMPLALLWSTAATTLIVGCWVARAIYRRGYSRSQESRRAPLSALPIIDRFLEISTAPLELRFRSLLLKDLRSFIRDTTQWSQLLLLLALIVIYLYNFSVLPANFTFAALDLENVFSFMNLGLAGFVLSAVAVRFVFTSVSAEGPAFWIIRSSPLSLNRFLWSKFWTCLPPLLVLSQILTLVSNYFLGATLFMTILASVTILCVTFGIVGMGVGMGAIFPRFKFENVTQIAGSSGGLLYMMVTTGFIAIVLLLEAVPVYIYFFTRHGAAPTLTVVTLLSLIAVIALNLAAVFVPMRLGRQRLAQLEL